MVLDLYPLPGTRRSMVRRSWTGDRIHVRSKMIREFESAKELSHTISWGITLAILSNIAQYVWWKTSLSRRGTHMQKFAPFYVTLLAVPLVMADLTRHVLQDSGFWPAPGSSMYRSNCKSHWRILCLSQIGFWFTIVFTYSGFACLVIGTIWASNVLPKIKKAWRRLRRSQGGRGERQD
eukprot:CFRG4789T1